jgi:hypothetical protein
MRAYIKAHPDDFEEKEDALCQMLTDLRHWAHKNRVDFDDAKASRINNLNDIHPCGVIV